MPIERDLVGYGRTRPDIVWPNGARVAVSLVLNFEEGAELDRGAEACLRMGGLEGAGVGVTGARLLALGLEQAAETEQRPGGHLLVAGRGGLLVHPCGTLAFPHLLQQRAEPEG